MGSPLTAQYSYVLVRTSNLSPIGVLARASNKSFSVGLNQTGDASFALPIFDRLADAIVPLQTALIIYRNRVAIFGGPIISVQEDGPSATIQVAAKGWFHLLERRIMRMTTPANPSVSMTNPSFASSTTGWDVYSGTTITRDTVVFDSSTASGKLTNSGSTSVMGGQGKFTGTNPVAGHDYILTFKWRYTTSLTNLAAIAALVGANPLVYFAFGSFSPDDVAIYNIPWQTASKDTWYTVTIPWTPMRTDVTWTSSTSYAKFPGKGYGSTNAAFRFYCYTGVASLNLPADLTFWVDSFSLTATSLPILQKTYSTTEACTIASGIITDMNADASSGITVGTAPSTATRTRTYKKYDNVGRAIQELAEVENGYDWYINPTTRVFDMYSSRGTTRPNVHFGYRAGSDNLASLQRSLDASSLANYVVATGKYGTGVSSDATSIAQYGVMEDVVSIGDFASSDYNSTLLAVSGAELLVRKQPRQVFSIVPKPANYSPSAGNPVPEPFAEYDIGDTVYFSGKIGRLNIENQPVRVFGLNISIDETGVERVNEIKVVYR